MAPERFRALDWLRGGAVLVMIQCHAMNKWLLHGLRGSELFRRLDFVDGLVAPSFLFAAGFSLALVQLRGGMTPARVRKSAQRLGEVLAVLDQRERRIISSRFGLEGEAPKTLEEVGKRFGVTRERIRQIQNSALSKLRRRLLKEENFPEYFRKLVNRSGLVRLA
jgi:hypothetical protein